MSDKRIVKARKVGNLNLILDTISDDEALICGLGRFENETAVIKKEDTKDVLTVFGLSFIK